MPEVQHSNSSTVQCHNQKGKSFCSMVLIVLENFTPCHSREFIGEALLNYR